MSPITDTLDRIQEMRQQFPRCVYCGRSVRDTALRNLMVVQLDGRQPRLAHSVCPIVYSEYPD